MASGKRMNGEDGSRRLRPRRRGLVGGVGELGAGEMGGGGRGAGWGIAAPRVRRTKRNREEEEGKKKHSLCVHTGPGRERRGEGGEGWWW